MQHEIYISEEEYRDELRGILQDYHRRELRRHLLGPLFSVVAHVLLIALVMAVFNFDREQPVIEDGPVVYQSVRPIVDELDFLDPPPEELITEIIPDMPSDAYAPKIPEAPSTPDPIAPTDDDPVELPTNLDPGIDGDWDTDSGMILVDLDFGATGMVMPVLESRGEAKRQALKTGQTSPEAQKAVLRALDWLASVQEDDGSWAHSQGHTGMALLTFLGHGETPMSERYGDTVLRAMRWVATNLNNGSKQGGDGHQYGHGIMTYAAAESYALTNMPQMGQAMEVGIARIIEGQQPGGGFDYRYAQGKRWDLSFAGWQFQALKAARVAGSRHPQLDSAIAKSVEFLKDTAYKNKQFGYTNPGTGGNMTGVGALSLQIAGAGNEREAQAAAQTIHLQRLPLYENVAKGKKDWDTVAGKSLYGWYYDTQVMFNVHGKTWKDWQRTFEKVLIRHQHDKGYWAVESGHGMDDKNDRGRILSTCWATLQLEVTYRHMSMNKDLASRPRVTASLDLDSGLIIER